MSGLSAPTAAMKVPGRSLVAGVPAKVIRTLKDEEIAWKLEGTRAYQALARRSLASMREVEPLRQPEAGRTRRLTYRDLQGPVRQAHIHVAQTSVNGAIVLWLCQTALNPAPASVAARVQPCPQAGTVSGRLTAEDVVATMNRILDEATASLDSRQVQRLFDLVAQWKEQGKAIVYEPVSEGAVLRAPCARATSRPAEARISWPKAP